MNYYLIAGEASGDLHGSNLLRALKEMDTDARFRFFGGDLMEAAAGLPAAKHISALSFMGFVEVIANLRTIFRNLDFAKRDILAFAPDALVLIDFSGFNLRIAKFAKRSGIKVFYYISPKIWAWNPGRAHTVRRVVDKMLCILPFEVDFYKKYGVDAVYVGNPLLDAIAAHRPDQGFIDTMRAPGQKLIALLPGSRRSEIRRLLPEMLGAMKLLPGYRAVIAGAPNFSQADYDAITGGALPVVFGHTYDLLLAADAAVVTSGTAVLETALLKTPQVAVYKENALTVAIFRRLLTIRYITLPNLILDREIVKELIQEACTPAKISQELTLLASETQKKSGQMRDYDNLSAIMGVKGASFKAAECILQSI